MYFRPPGEGSELTRVGHIAGGVGRWRDAMSVGPSSSLSTGKSSDDPSEDGGSGGTEEFASLNNSLKGITSSAGSSRLGSKHGKEPNLTTGE